MEKNKQIKSGNYLIQTILVIAMLFLLNILANSRLGGFPLYKKWDLTEEGRFTLTQGTDRMLRNLDDVVDVKILLDGEFPAGFKRLQREIIETLEDFRGASGFVEYYLENPTPVGLDVESINERREVLKKDGVLPVRLNVQSVDGREEIYIYPWAQISYKGRTINVNLLENQAVATPESSEMALNTSIALLEYKFADAIQKLQISRKPIVVFTTGHGELSKFETASIEFQLRKYYDTGRIHLDSMVAISQDADVLVIAKPTQPFSEKDKFKIDQYIMNGGKVMFLLDQVGVDMDSLRSRAEFLALPNDTKLDDLLFKYGLRVDPNLVLDLQHSQIPLQTGIQGGKPQLELFGYPYHLVITSNHEHPIAKRLGPINLKFAGIIDTSVQVKTALQKHILLSTTPNTRMQATPLTMSFEFLRYPLQPDQFNGGSQPVAVLAEGVFPSLYANRATASMKAGLASLDLELMEESRPTQVIVVSDGDIARNTFDPVKQVPEPLGRNPYDRFQYSNPEFLMNAIGYLLDQNGVLEARGKEVKLRLLNETKAQEERVKWQLINLVYPLVGLALFGLGFNWWRRRKYAIPATKA